MTTTSASTWPEVLNQLTDRAAKEGLLDRLKAAKTISDKVKIVRDAPGIRRRLASWISHCSESKFQKNGGVASKLRDEGNLKYQRGDFAESMKLYSQAVISAPEYGPELALAFGNRSACLYNQGQFSSCLQDIALALKYRFPKDNAHRLLQRRGMCQIKLNLLKEASESLDEAEASLMNNCPKMPKAKRQSLLRDMKALRVEIETKLQMATNESPVNESTTVDDDKDIFEEHPKLTGASIGLDLCTDAELGRFIKTNRDFEVGDLVFSEEPFGSVLLPEHFSTHCYHCHREVQLPVPCLKCTQSRYCSEDCRSKSWDEYHSIECNSLELLNSVGVAHLALRLVLVAGLPKLSQLRHVLTKDLEHLQPVERYHQVINLVEHSKASSKEDVFQYTVTGILLAMFLETRTKFLVENQMNQLSLNTDNHEPCMVEFIEALITKHVFQLICNGSAIYEVGCTDTGSANVFSEEQVRIATAIYPSASMMNHSCDPSVINSFDGRRLLVRAIKTLKANEEVMNCYGPHYRRHERRERKKVLSSQYNFWCSCPHCDSGSSNDDFMAQFYSLSCFFCHGPVAITSEDESVCGKCGKSCNFDREVEEMIRANELFSQALMYTNNGLHSLAVDLLKQCLEIRDRVLPKYHQDLLEVQDLLAKTYAMLGNYDNSIILLLLNLEKVEYRYGASSIEYGHELLKLADLLEVGANGASRVKRLSYLQKALQIFRAHYGPGHKLYKSTKENIDRQTLL